MSHSKLKLAAFSLGALAVCLSASAETPGLEHIGCCSAGVWAQAVDAKALSESSNDGGYIQRGRARGDWRVHFAGVTTPGVALPRAIDHALQHALGAAPPAATPAHAVYGDDSSYDETYSQWKFRTLLVWDGADGPWRGVRKCPDQHEAWCHRRPPPPPPGAVPEPDVWALLVVGLAAIGGVLRRRRAAAAATLSA